MIPNHSSANTHSASINPQQDASSTPQAASLSRSRRSVGEPGKYWPQNSTITIALYDVEMSDPYVLAVKKAASHWLPHINLTFEFVSGEDGNIRITQNFHSKAGSSLIGTDALNTTWRPTMSLPIDHLAPEFEDTVMHEFGHMLGAHHEHQHPDANIPWDIDKLKQHFSQQTLEDNFLPMLNDSLHDYLPYDPDSVMHYFFDPNWTEGSWGQTKSWVLSDGDIAWAKKAYPKVPMNDSTGPTSHHSTHLPENIPAPRAARRPARRAADSDCRTPGAARKIG